MLEPPDVEIGELLARVRQRFGVDARSAEFLPIGNDSNAWAFRLSSTQDAWFLKVLARPVDPASIEIPRFLADHGVPEVVAPLQTVAGEAADPGGPFSLVLYPFVDARRAADVELTSAQRRDAGSLLRRIHDVELSAELDTILRTERFEPPAVDLARRVAEAVARPTPGDPLQRELAARWSDRGSEIDALVRRAEELGAAVRRVRHAFVLCHADFHAWNVLVRTAGDLLVVDWDEVVLAPRERDLMFVDESVGSLDPEQEAFFKGYGEVAIDPLLIAYYRFDWAVQELADYGRRVFFTPIVGERTREDAVGMFAALFEPDDVVDAAYRADAALER